MSPPHQLPPQFAAMLSSFRLALRAPGKSERTVRTYLDAATKLAWWLLDTGRGSDWSAADKHVIQAYMVWFQNDARKCCCGKRAAHPAEPCPQGVPYEKGYSNNQYRALQQFFRWYAEEEDVPNPMLGLKPPSAGEKVVPVIGEDDLSRLIRHCEAGRDYESRRDAAILRMFASTGARLSEVAMLDLDDVNLDTLEALVTGKGDRQRIIKFDIRCARAVDRYLRARAAHKLAAHTSRLWLGTNNRGPLTPNGMRQVIERRGEQVGLRINPHQFRHTFTHRWLDAGGAEGDLMELNGWESPQMLRRYGKSARAARARRAYDRINVMGDI